MIIKKLFPDENVSILLGNGFSMGISDKFSYKKLIDKMTFKWLKSCSYHLTENQIKEISNSFNDYRMARQLMRNFHVPEKLRPGLLRWFNEARDGVSRTSSYEDILREFSYEKMQASLPKIYTSAGLPWKNFSKEQYTRARKQDVDPSFITSILESYIEIFDEPYIQEKMQFWQKNLQNHTVFTTNYDPLVHNANPGAIYLHGPLDLLNRSEDSWKTCIIEPEPKDKLAKIKNDKDLQQRWDCFNAIAGKLVV